MSFFAANTGCRDSEICNLKWEWEIFVPDLGCSIFIIPRLKVKNREDRLVVLNDIARSVVEECRGQHPVYVFTYEGKPITRMLNTAWKNARQKVGLPDVRVHDLKHTFGRRLRAAGVSFEDRQDLLGHKSQRITTHYSAAEMGNLLFAANKACVRPAAPILTILTRKKVSTAEQSQLADTFGGMQGFMKYSAQFSMGVEKGHAKVTQAVLQQCGSLV